MTDKKKIRKLIYILAAALIIVLSMVSVGYAKPFKGSLVNLTIPSSINLQQSNNGDINISEFKVENSSSLDYVIENIKTTPANGWSLVNEKGKLENNQRKLYMSIENNVLKLGENPTHIKIHSYNWKTLNIQALLGVFTEKIGEKALDLTLDYNYLDKPFEIKFDTAFEQTIEPITAMSGTLVNLPKPANEYAQFLYWKDKNTHEIYQDTMIVPVGGTELLAVWKEVYMDLNKFQKITPMIGGGIAEANQADGDKAITGIHIKSAFNVPSGHEQWDISQNMDNSVVAYRAAVDPNAQDYNDVIIAVKSNNLHLAGNPKLLFASKNHTTPIRFIKSDNVHLKFVANSIDDTFRGCRKLQDISGLGYLETSNITSMSRTFLNCNSINDYSIFSSWDVSHVTNMDMLFCYNVGMVTCMPFENWDVSNVMHMENIFSFNPRLSHADLINWNMDKVQYTETTGTFIGCKLEVALCAKEEYLPFLNYRRRDNEVKFVAPHTITFVTDGNEQYDTIKDYTNQIIKLPIPTKEGFQFNGWLGSDNILYTEDFQMPNYDLVLTAQWGM